MTSTPKSPFPDALLPYLVEKVTKLATGNLVWLIESLYQDMKVHKIKKNSIEAKMREVAEKCPSKRIWVIKDEVLVRDSKYLQILIANSTCSVHWEEHRSV